MSGIKNLKRGNLIIILLILNLFYPLVSYSTDSDGNGIQDEFELALARKFSPSLVLHSQDQGVCPKPVEIIGAHSPRNLWIRTFNVPLGQLVGEYNCNQFNPLISYCLMPEDSDLSTSMRRDSVLFSFIQKELRSPTKAFLIAFLPGSVVHGAGHFYAKKPKTGRILLATEGVGVLFTFYGWAGLFALGLESLDGGGWEGWEKWERKKDIFNVLLYSGITLFVGSWVYDMIGAPLQAKAHNKKIMERYGLSLKIHPQKNEMKLILVKNF